MSCKKIKPHIPERIEYTPKNPSWDKAIKKNPKLK